MFLLYYRSSFGFQTPGEAKMQVSGNYNDHQCRLETLDDAALWTTADIGYGKTPIAVLALSDWIYILSQEFESRLSRHPLVRYH
jgi:hypothetical protein